jgi:TatD DNase family protein
MLEMLRNVHKSTGGPLRGVLHSFSESWEVAEEMLGMGLFISFAGMVTYKKSEALRAVAARIPLDRILVETDSPYLAPEPFRSKGANEPSRVLATAQCIAQVRGIPLADLATATTANALRCFPKLRG